MHMTDETPYYADVVLPLALPAPYYTYRVPPAMQKDISKGKRVLVQFGPRKIYTAIVIALHHHPPLSGKTKEILEIVDDTPMVNDLQLAFWQWMSTYYLCNPGEVMNAALPAPFKLESETRISFHPAFISSGDLSEKEQALLNLIKQKKKIPAGKLLKEWKNKNLMSLLQSLLLRGAISVEEELEKKTGGEKDIFLTLDPSFHDKEALCTLKEKLRRAPKQLEMLECFLSCSHAENGTETLQVRRSRLLKECKGSYAVCDTLIRKGILRIKEKTADIPPPETFPDHSINPLTPAQQKAFDNIIRAFSRKNVVLLHGVTSSGKTEIYFHLIEKTLQEGKQVLFMMPEIALTTQMAQRVKKIFGNRVAIYHSKHPERQRADIWQGLLRNEIQIVLGVRSSLFLPFSSLGLVIVDEEHEPSYKQFEPAPRYHARDAVIMLATLHKASVLLGSATPSLESYFNSMTGKYERVVLAERYGNIQLPLIQVTDILKAVKKKQFHIHFTEALLASIRQTLDRGKQVILFQNRRGFSLFFQCTECGWIPRCRHCNISLTYHKSIHRMVCHYCGHSSIPPVECPECKKNSLRMMGFGTEKAAESIQHFFPQARIARLDLDSARSHKHYEDILTDFEAGNIDILIGTQMITKGLDFPNVALVGILNADNLLNFPDFRSFERGYQLMAQVAGRAGRKNEQGLVVIQTSHPEHPVIRQVVHYDYEGMCSEQLKERKIFGYPPFTRLIRIIIQHHKENVCEEASAMLASRFKAIKEIEVAGPMMPAVARIKGRHVRHVVIKIPRHQTLSMVKEKVREIMQSVHRDRSFGGLSVYADVDPY